MKQKAKLRYALRKQVEDWAQEQAVNDLKFSGDEPWKNVPAEKRKLLEAALIFYARSAAARTFDSLVLHKHLNDSLLDQEPHYQGGKR